MYRPESFGVRVMKHSSVPSLTLTEYVAEAGVIRSDAESKRRVRIGSI